MYIIERKFDYCMPVDVCRFYLFVHSCNGNYKKVNSTNIITNTTSFSYKFGMHVDEYIKRKTK